MDRYCRWADQGYLSSTGSCFDIGNTVASALRKDQCEGNPYAGSTDPNTAGNGCIMRLAPVAMRFFPDLDAVERFAADSSRTTHGAEESSTRAGCSPGSFAVPSWDGPRGSPLRRCRLVLLERAYLGDRACVLPDEVGGDDSRFGLRSRESGGGVVGFRAYGKFPRRHPQGANLGDDADTTAAVCGQVAGAYYGERGIPPRWLDRLALRSKITKMADQLVRRPKARSRAQKRASGIMELDFSGKSEVMRGKTS